ncbi:hypothetical protein SAMD00019534_032000 [Acytostelium subglobosum LB1]|uniref:hypothetical protein n=1 Tax=Acytostelium subglobosum LB1 TaxID=1410327 RepID=UPI000645110A|nr:hypothetical protein SAMD00019534_032000 [Acytostelium subglobosum LB1]GAM20025.1 hypothetical protein SAMD00019534_032000 [Acytostelium subglobosum LB1]|eukprot:XP_012756787.1 hypothetical protein SAMD00019534_032000 [Acytostelium subglobosum LB1]
MSHGYLYKLGRSLATSTVNKSIGTNGLNNLQSMSLMRSSMLNINNINNNTGSRAHYSRASLNDARRSVRASAKVAAAAKASSNEKPASKFDQFDYDKEEYDQLTNPVKDVLAEDNEEDIYNAQYGDEMEELEQSNNKQHEWHLKDQDITDDQITQITKKISDYYTPTKEMITVDVFKSQQLSLLNKCQNLIQQAEKFLGNKDIEKAEPLLLGAQSYFVNNKDAIESGNNDPNCPPQLIHAYILSYLANINQSKNSYEVAKEYYTSSLQLLENSVDKSFYAVTLLNYAELLSNMDIQQDCIATCLKAIQILENSPLKSSDERLMFALFNMSSYLSQQSRFAEALPYCLRAFEGLSKGLGRNNEVVHTVAANLSKIYQQLNMTNELKSLDELFEQDPEGIVTFETSADDLAHINTDKLRQTWLQQGHQRPADIDGFFKSSKTSQKEFSAFFKQMEKKGISCGPESLELLTNELSSIQYAPDRLEMWKPKTYTLGVDTQ